MLGGGLDGCGEWHVLAGAWKGHCAGGARKGCLQEVGAAVRKALHLFMRFFVRSTLLSLVAFSVLAEAETVWPEFRGPGAQGHSGATGLPTSWSRTEGLRWRQELPGLAWSQPIVAGGKIFLTNAVGTEKEVSLRVLALDAVTGKQLWDVEVLHVTKAAALQMHKKNSHASPTPITEDGKIYAHFSHHGTACVSAEGKVLWTSTENPYSPVHGTGGSPVLAGDLLIFNADAAANPSVVALRKRTGKTEWRVQRSSGAQRKFSFSTPLLIEVGGKSQLISAGSGVVQALEPESGKEIWQVQYDQGYSVVPRPVFAHGLVFLSTGYDKPLGLAIRPDGKGDVTATHVAWRADKRVPHNPSMLVVGDELYMLDDKGMLSSRDAKTGTVHYEERLLGPSSASLLAADGHIYAIDEMGKAAVVVPGKQLKVLATNDLAEKTLASMAVVESDLLIRTQKALYRVGK
jgi:outer membrane protein assembly factor BamB